MDEIILSSETLQSVKLCSGHGVNYTNKNGKHPYITTTFNEIESLLEYPQDVAKEDAQWAIFSSHLSREAAEQLKYGKFYAVWCDFDKHTEIEPIIAVLAALGVVYYYVYSTKSATENEKRWRVIIPLATPANATQWQQIAAIINDKFKAANITPDKVSDRANQICYLPNAGEYYDYSLSKGVPFNWVKSLKTELLEKENQAIAEKQRRDELQEQSRLKAIQRIAAGVKSPIDAYNAAYPVEQVLDYYGYEHAGKRWLSPNSESGNAGVDITDDGKWLSSHASDAGIGKKTSNGTMGDAFDLYCYYEHGNDRDKALKAAGSMFMTSEGVTITKANQIAYKTSNEGKDVSQSVVVDDAEAATHVSHTGCVLRKLDEKIHDALFPHVLIKTKRNKIIQSTIQNLEYLLQAYGITLEYDEILKRRSIVFADNGAKGHDMEDECALMRIRSLCSLNELHPSVTELLPALFVKNTVNPILNWIQSKPWDGVDRKQLLYKTLSVAPEDENYRNQVLNVWLLQCVAAADNGEIGHKLNPENAVRKFELVLILQGKQGAKKTSWFNSLLPDSLRDYVKDGMHLDPADKDTVKKCISTWICELGEIDATFRKADVERFKAFLSNQSDEIRLPYDKTPVHFKRRTSFGASVNSEQFLVDPTGSRRFIPVQVFACDYAHGLDMQQVFAQVWVEYNSGAIWWLDDKLANEIRLRSEKHNEISSVVERVSECFFVDEPDLVSPHLTVTKILMDSGISDPKQKQIKDLSEFLQSKGFRFKTVKGVRGFSISHKSHY